MRKWNINWRIFIVIGFVFLMAFAISSMLPGSLKTVNNGRADLSKVDFGKNELASLNGNWEFYWNRLLSPADFSSGKKPVVDSFMKIPGSWYDEKNGESSYPSHGVATYRMKLRYEAVIKDPAIKIMRVAAAYKVYANGRLVEEVGKVSDDILDFKSGYNIVIADLPKYEKDIDVIIQVANLSYDRGGIRQSPIFGSKEALERQKMMLVGLQLLFIGSVFVFGVYYMFLFLLQNKNKTALFFSILCFITAIRSFIWGEIPLYIFIDNPPISVSVFINYFTGYNMLPIMILFIVSIYSSDYKKVSLGAVILPTIFFNVLLFTSSGFMSSFNNYFYGLMILQMIYLLSYMMKVVIRKRDNGILMLFAIGILVLAIIIDMLNYRGLGKINISYMTLFGNFIVIIAMSFVQARQQSETNRKLILFNQNLIESDKLRDKIVETEMSFLQAQIKPHFLYNALNAIANVCEKDGKKAGKLILDLAVYLRGSLEFNNLDKMMKLEKELEFVDTYFNIERARFGEKIRLVKEVGVSLDYQIPVLILQPLVENAVRHGISKKQGGGTVYLKMNQTDDGVNIEITDDGVGMDEGRVSELLTECGTNKSVGLQNINNRLLKVYGSGLEISSQNGLGTTVGILIPKVEKKI